MLPTGPERRPGTIKAVLFQERLQMLPEMPGWLLDGLVACDLTMKACRVAEA